MSSPPIEYLQHMLAEADFIVDRGATVNRDTFLRDETLKRAIVRSIEIIGEAAKHVPEEFRQQHSDIEWRAMAGMRDRLIHGYFGVDYALVWDVAANKSRRFDTNWRICWESLVNNECQTAFAARSIEV
jgi:uncharacterized protein with HEPN domain